jgi:flagellar biosynthetic protein FliR
VNLALPAFDAVPWFVQFTLAAVRPLAMVVLLPGIAGADLPWRARLALVAALAVFAGFRPGAATLSPAGIPAELLAGLVCGLALALAFGAATLAGELIAQMVGLGFAMLGPMAGSGGALPALFTTICWVALLAGDLHTEWLLLAATGMALPASQLSVQSIASFGGLMFLWGLGVAMPLLAVLLLANAVVALANRAAPQLSVVAVGPAALLLAFITLLPLVLGQVSAWLASALAAGLGLIG